MARNRLLYRRTLTQSAYAAWLARSAVQYVVLTPYPLDDHGAGAEARLLRAPAPGLRVVWKHAGFTIFSVAQRARLMTGSAGARVITFSHDQIAGVSRRQGVETLRVSYSPYWTTSGAASCVVRGRRGMSSVLFARGGRFSLSMTRDPLVIARRLADPDC